MLSISISVPTFLSSFHVKSLACVLRFPALFLNYLAIFYVYPFPNILHLIYSYLLIYFLFYFMSSILRDISTFDHDSVYSTRILVHFQPCAKFPPSGHLTDLTYLLIRKKNKKNFPKNSEKIQRKSHEDTMKSIAIIVLNAHLITVGARHNLVERARERSLDPPRSPVRLVRHCVVDIIGVDDADHMGEFLAPVRPRCSEPVQVLWLLHDAHIRLQEQKKSGTILCMYVSACVHA